MTIVEKMLLLTVARYLVTKAGEQEQDDPVIKKMKGYIHQVQQSLSPSLSTE